jgi:hypothetical protein
MSEWSCSVTISKTWSNVVIVADTAEQAEEMAGQMNEVDLNKADPTPDEEMTVEEVECVADCDEDEENED